MHASFRRQLAWLVRFQLSRTVLACLSMLLATCYFTPCLAAPPTDKSDDKGDAYPEQPITAKDREHWSFRPRANPTAPVVANHRLARTSIDRFILAKLEPMGLTLQPEADRATLLRRLFFDLTGLPPTLDQLAQFESNRSPDAYERLVDQLLASPEYGRRWAQHWLELARFAETDGYEHDKVRRDAWRYRDWVIDAFNRNTPIDQFIAQQIAGDRMNPGDEQARWATGFCTAGPDMPDINSLDERRHHFLNEMTATVGSAILGLQFGCAQCHDHKFDPISQFDFYRLRAFFDSAVTLTQNQSVAFLSRSDSKSPSRYMIRGDWRRPGPEVEPHVPRVVHNSPRGLPAAAAGNRLALARWLVRPENPLTARVFVNRVWQHHFGEGLSNTPSDFGSMGDEPIYVELLDHLASRFVDAGWNLKRLHRWIVTSSVYRQTSLADSTTNQQPAPTWLAALKKDRENLFLSRFPRRRLDGESIRDAMLSIAGQLNSVGGGPGVRPPLPKELVGSLLKNHWNVDRDPADHVRRSIYVFARRNLRYPIFEAFDRPDPNASCPRRNRSTTAPQSLMLLNGELTASLAQVTAGRLLLKQKTADARLIEAFRLIVSRKPTSEEHKSMAAFLDSQASRLGDESDSRSGRLPIPMPEAIDRGRAAAWTDLCVALFNSNAFIYVD